MHKDANVNEDEYGCVVKSMPPDMSAADFFKTLERNFNDTLQSTQFNLLATFQPDADVRGPDPQVGDTYSVVPIYGLGAYSGRCMPASAPIIVVDQEPDSLVVATLTGHPEAGVRRFGYVIESDNTTVFYTQGASQLSDALMNDLAHCPSVLADNKVWDGSSAQRWVVNTGASIMAASQVYIWETYVNRICAVLESRGAVIEGPYGPRQPRRSNP